jgi:hypothetical protein
MVLYSTRSPFLKRSISVLFVTIISGEPTLGPASALPRLETGCNTSYNNLTVIRPGRHHLGESFPAGVGAEAATDVRGMPGVPHPIFRRGGLAFLL